MTNEELEVLKMRTSKLTPEQRGALEEASKNVLYILAKLDVFRDGSQIGDELKMQFFNKAVEILQESRLMIAAAHEIEMGTDGEWELSDYITRQIPSRADAKLFEVLTLSMMCLMPGAMYGRPHMLDSREAMIEDENYQSPEDAVEILTKLEDYVAGASNEKRWLKQVQKRMGYIESNGIGEAIISTEIQEHAA